LIPRWPRTRSSSCQVMPCRTGASGYTAVGDLARDFLQMHRALDAPTTRLEQDQRLAEWLRALIERSSAVRPLRSRGRGGEPDPRSSE
jgi:hypothetical protein